MSQVGSIVEYHGRRVGRVFRIKYVDADGRQIMKTVGRERDGMTKMKAKMRLQQVLAQLEPERISEREFAQRGSVEKTYSYLRKTIAEAERLRGELRGADRRQFDNAFSALYRVEDVLVKLR